MVFPHNHLGAPVKMQIPHLHSRARQLHFKKFAEPFSHTAQPGNLASQVCFGRDVGYESQVI